MPLGNQRAHLHILGHRIANPHGAGPFDQRRLEIGSDAGLDKHPRGVRADLAGGVEIGIKRGLDGKVEIGIGKDDQR